MGERQNISTQTTIGEDNLWSLSTGAHREQVEKAGHCRLGFGSIIIVMLFGSGGGGGCIRKL